MDERLKFVARLLDGEKMAVLCREFEISRKIGCKVAAFARVKLAPRLCRRPGECVTVDWRALQGRYDRQIPKSGDTPSRT